ncbi:hypothetical protein FOA43_001539 [Brettanomyces nanus]|uniref:Uncharacterized protein n=1 Tax=Eeniella nana TaxID=13502 RepID=A0A875S1K4_EENNA|nr:uncharacterized protein FOA43_001539 [Brettanomyces nanus]QPG74215.1 hypothetical protein FOA43_001539 [Brettanomyces nanus]
MSDDLIHQFSDVTGATHDLGEQYLARNGNDLTNALNDYYRDSAGREPTPAIDSHPEKRHSDSKFRTMMDVIDHNDDNDDDETNLFTGGEKSGLEVENPDNKNNGGRGNGSGAADSGSKNPMNLVEDLLKKAEREAGEPDTREPIAQAKQPKFKGTGYMLGSKENSVESSKIADPNERLKRKIPEKITRTITFWKEGFQVDEGKLYRYDDPENAEYLKQLNQGRAPLSLLNVEMFQDVDVHVIKKLEDSFKPPKRKLGGFLGEGQRLGSPVPGETIIVEGDRGEAKVEDELEKNGEQEEQKKEETQEEGGDARIQIRLAEGERFVHGFNSSDKVSAVFDYVASKTTDSRTWSLAFAFPLRYIDDMKEKTIGEAGLANSVILQRWR